jgi:putative ABC transport system permease protein
LALCIGANSAIFSLIDAVLLRSLPYGHPERLVAIFETNPIRKTGRVGVAPVRISEWNRMSRSFNGMAGVNIDNLTDTSGALPEKLVIAAVSPGFFPVVGVRPLLGREFSPEEERYGGPNAALISERFWRRRFWGDPRALGRALRLNGDSCPIAGVLPASFRVPVSGDAVDVWLPAALPDSVMRNREARFYLTVARLKDGVSPAVAQADLDAVQGRLAKDYPATDANWKPAVSPLKEATVGGSKRGLWILFGAVSLVLLIGCANVACLLLAQAQRRTREMAIRFSLGARRVQVIRELLLEAFLIALPGALLGLLLSEWGTDGLRALAQQQLPRADEIHLSWLVVAFTLLLSVVTTFLFGLIPAWTAAQADTAIVLAQGSRTQAGDSRRPLLRLLVAGQIAMAVILMVGAGLLIRTMASLTNVPLGFDTHNLLTLHISASWGEQSDYKGVQHRLQRTLAAIENTPGVESAATALNPPGGMSADYNLEFRIAGRDSSGPGEKLLASAPVVSASYFRTLGIPFLAGGMCRDDPDSKGPQQAVVNKQFASRFFPNENPVGHILLAGEGAKAASSTIVGVVADSRDGNRTQAPAPTAYWCTLPGFFPDPLYVIKTHGPPMSMANTLRQRIKQLEPGRAVYDVVTLDDQIASSFGERRLQTVLLGLFGLAALLLASIGLYGVVSYYVSQRTREIGLRMALGARPDQVLGTVFQQGAVMTIGGIVVGIAGGAAVAKLMTSLLFGVGAWDPVTFVAAPAALLAVAALATWLPARRAMLVDPMSALRQE